MLAHDKPRPSAAVAVASGEISTGSLLEALAAHKDKALVFDYDGREVQPGYHVTEVKAGQFAALDCGANPESWRETFIQLWDVPAEGGRSFMRVGRFLAIMGKVAAEIPFDPDAKLTFEVSDPMSAMQLFATSAIEVDAATVRVSLARRPASCKPRDRWLEQQTGPRASACCAPKQAAPCCN